MKKETRAKALAAGYRSNYEFNIAKNLKSRKVGFEYEAYVFDYTQPAKNRTYTPDFIFEKKDGSLMYIEAKGKFTQANRETALWVREAYPEADIRFLFQRPYNKISKNSKTTYASWCDKKGFKWANYFMPDEWLEEIKQ